MYVFPMASDTLETLQCFPPVGKQELCISGMPSIKSLKEMLYEWATLVEQTHTDPLFL